MKFINWKSQELKVKKVKKYKFYKFFFSKNFYFAIACSDIYKGWGKKYYLNIIIDAIVHCTLE